MAIAIRGTEGWLEWIRDLGLPSAVPFPLVGAGQHRSGFTVMYSFPEDQAAAGHRRWWTSSRNCPLPQRVGSVTICGRGLGGALATLLALDVAANTTFTNPAVYTYGSPRTGDSLFAGHLRPGGHQLLARREPPGHRPRAAPDLDYEHVLNPVELIPVRLVPWPPKTLVKYTVSCEHSLATYLYLLSLQSGGPGASPRPRLQTVKAQAMSSSAL